MRVLIVSETFPPLLRASARIMKDLAIAFRDNGNEVYVLTVIENHAQYKYISTGLFREEGYDVLRIRTLPQRNVGYFRRGIAETLLPFIVARKALKAFADRSFDLIIAHSPPISLCHLLRVLKNKSNCPLFLVLRDIHPQTGIDLSVFKENGIVHKYFRWIEKRLYSLCDIIAPQSPANKMFLLKTNPQLEDEKVSVLYNWKTVSKKSDVGIVDFRERFGLTGKTVCLYGGNMTSSQDLMDLILTADQCSFLQDVVFLVIGFGTQRDMIRQKAAEKGLKNIIFEDPLSLENFTMLVHQCDIGLIYLNKCFKTHNFPGKMLDYMDASLPIVASVNNGNDIAETLEGKAHCGFVHYDNDFNGMAKSIALLANDVSLRKTMGENGKRFLEHELNAQKACETIMLEIEKLKLRRSNHA